MKNAANDQNIVKYTSSPAMLGPFVSVADKEGYKQITGKDLFDKNVDAYFTGHFVGYSARQITDFRAIPDFHTARTEYLLAWKALNKQYCQLKRTMGFVLKTVGLCGSAAIIMGLITGGLAVAVGPAVLMVAFGMATYDNYEVYSRELKTKLHKLNSDEQRYIVGVMTSPSMTARNAAKQTVQQEIDRLQALVRSIDNGAVAPEVALATLKGAPAAQPVEAQHIELAAEKAATPARPAVSVKSTRAARTIGNSIQA